MKMEILKVEDNSIRDHALVPMVACIMAGCGGSPWYPDPDEAPNGVKCK